MNIVDAYIEQGRAEGHRTGKIEGKLEGKLEGEQNLLLKQLRKRFGPLSDAMIARVQSAREDELELWSERILSAPSLTDVFA